MIRKQSHGILIHGLRSHDVQAVEVFQIEVESERK